MQETTEELLQGRMLDILNNVNACIDHVPPVGTEYEFEVRFECERVRSFACSLFPAEMIVSLRGKTKPSARLTSSRSRITYKLRTAHPRGLFARFEVPETCAAVSKERSECPFNISDEYASFEKNSGAIFF